jgi:hypothetical protein
MGYPNYGITKFMTKMMANTLAIDRLPANLFGIGGSNGGN